MSLIPDLPNNTTGWTIQLGHAFFATLHEYIQYRLLYRLYTLPILSGWSKTIESIAALRSVRSEAVKEFKATSRYRKRFAKYMDQIGSAKKHTFKDQLQLTQPVAEVPVINSELEEETKPRFYKK